MESGTTQAAALRRLNPAWLDRHGVSVVGFNAGRLVVAMPDCSDAAVLAGLRFAAGCEIEPITATGSKEAAQPSLIDLAARRFRPNEALRLVEIAAIALAAMLAWATLSQGVAAMSGAAALLAGTHLRLTHDPAALTAARLCGGVLIAAALIVLAGQ
jgi:Type II secretion system (T2SS), protein E, N-terminal domain